MSLAIAYAETALIKAKTHENIDPLAERQRADNSIYETVDDLAEDWLKDCTKHLKHPNIPRRVYTKEIAPYIGELSIECVTPIDIRAIVRKVADSDRPSIANDALMYCKQLFRHGIKLNLLTNNPAEAFTVNDAGGVEKSRSRVLGLDEIKAVFKAFNEPSNQFSRENTLAAALLITLGIRKGELIAAKWSAFDTKKKLWNIPEDRSKTGIALTVPLTDEVLEWLHELYTRANGSEFVFPKRPSSIRYGHISPDTLNAAIQKLHREGKLTVEHFTVHDLRRTFRSLLTSEGVPGHIVPVNSLRTLFLKNFHTPLVTYHH